MKQSDHDIAGNVAGVELEALSRWQLCALAIEALDAAIDRTGDGHDRRARRKLADALEATDRAMREFD